MSFIIQPARTKDGKLAFFGRHHNGSAYFNELSALSALVGWKITVRDEVHSSCHGMIENDPEHGAVFTGMGRVLVRFAPDSQIRIADPEARVKALKPHDFKYGVVLYLTPPTSSKDVRLDGVAELKRAFARQQCPNANEEELASTVKSLGNLPILEFQRS